MRRPFVVSAVAILVLAMPWSARRALAQQGTAILTVRVTSDGVPLENAVVRAGPRGAAARGAATNPAGLARLTLPAGMVTVRVTLLGYRPDSTLLTLVAGRDTSISFALAPAAEELQGVVVTSARGAKRIEREPTRIEVLGGDDVAEKTEMRPNDLRSFLSEMAGIRVQQTSAGSGATAVRMQGLRPRYTLLLADGLPLYGGTGGGGLDLLQLPPADLRQIEVIKGPASALYGASALGGTINLVSKRPGHEGDLLVQATSRDGSNALGWFSRRVNDRFGVTAVAGAHTQARTDVDGDGWADLPGYRRVEARPRLFLEGKDGSSLFVTVGATAEDREGGFVTGQRAPDGTAYGESADTRRGDAGAVAQRLIGSRTLLQLRGAANVDRKARTFGTEPEHVLRSTAFGELSLSSNVGRHDVVAGGAVQRDAAQVDERGSLDFTFVTTSVFAQDTWHLATPLALTASARADHHSRYGTQLSPRASLLYSFGGSWSLRASATRGYYAPTPFVEETDAVGVRGVRGFDALRAESATYGSVDLNGRVQAVELNATIFASRVRHPVVATPGAGAIGLANATANATSRGIETYAVYDLAPIFLTALYTYTDAREPQLATGASRREAPYAPRHTWGVDATWEDPARGTWVALEGFYTGRQALEDNPYRAEGRPYVAVGFLATQRVGRYKLFFNVENLTDRRLGRWDPVVLPSRAADGRWAVAPWAPTEGRILSAGVRISTRPAGDGRD